MSNQQIYFMISFIFEIFKSFKFIIFMIILRLCINAKVNSIFTIKNRIICVEFLQFAINQEEIRQKWLLSVQECQRLHAALEKSHQEASTLDKMLSHARRLLDEEKMKRRHAEDERNSLVNCHK